MSVAAEPTVADVIQQLTSRKVRGPSCRRLLMGCQGWTFDRGSFLGLACRKCDALYDLATEGVS